MLPLNFLVLIWHRLLNQFRKLFVPNTPSQSLHSFSQEDISRYFFNSVQNASSEIDNETWADLLLSEYLVYLSLTSSIFAKQILYARLRTGLAGENYHNNMARQKELMDNSFLVENLTKECSSLASADAEISALLFSPSDALALPIWGRYVIAIPTLFLLTLASLVFTQFAWIGVGGAFFLLLLVQNHLHLKINEWERTAQAIQMLLRTVSLLGHLAENQAVRIIAEFNEMQVLAGKINRKLSRSASMTLIPGLREYSDWFFLANVRHYFASVLVFIQHKEFLQKCFLDCANLEADLVLVKHRKNTQKTCTVDRISDKTIVMEEFIHPLLQNPTPLSICLKQKGWFISGQNGIGKSTLLRAVGLNLVISRAFGFCYARHARLPSLTVYTSMKNEDSLLAGESFYLSELRRSQTLLAAGRENKQAIYLIDELFRGTNHIEAISVGAAVLQALALNHPVIVCSHNLILAALLEAYLTPWHIALMVDTHESTSRLNLVPGLLQGTNGIKLLTQRGFDPEITKQAEKVRVWLESFMTHPPAATGILV